MSRLAVVLGIAAAAACAAACRSADPATSGSVTAVLAAKSGSRVAGRAVFTRLSGGWIHVRVQVSGAAPGLHAVHIHESADCSAPDAKSAGGHWNPTGRRHGRFGQPDGEFHLGDLGNLEVGADGRGALDLTTDLWTLGDRGPADVVGRSVVVHAKPDDFTTQPTGNSGDRIACGPIGGVE